MKQNFVFLDEMLPGIRWDAKYATWDNFTGKPVDGYGVNRIMGTKELGAALHKAQDLAEKLGYGLLLWDGYRPQCAVNCFLNWVSQPENNLTKKRYDPNIRREERVTKGYVAAQSSHSRGSAVDLTIFRLDTGMLVPMGGEFDFMDIRSHHAASGLSVTESKNRECLRSIMENSGFDACCFEWWHYVLADEPYPDTYFDFCIA